MQKFNTKLALLISYLFIATFMTAQVEIEHLSTSSSPTLKLTDTGENNFTRLFFANDFSAKEWRISSRAFTSSAETNKLDFNYYNGSSTSTYLSFDGDDSIIYANEDVVTQDRLFINSTPTVSSVAQVEVYTDTEFYAGTFHNESNSSTFNYGVLMTADGPGTGARVGGFGVANASSGVARGVYGLGDSSSGNEYGIYGEASGTSGSSWAIYGNGDIYYTGSFTAPSDARVKTNIKKLKPNVLENLMSLEVKTYEYNQTIYPSMNFAKGPQIGFLAQDLKALFPETVIEQNHLVYEIPGDIKSKESQIELLGVDYMKMIPILTSAIQEQNKLIEAIQAENKSLKDELTAIKNMIAELQN